MAIVSAGTLCAHRLPLVTALADETADEAETEDEENEDEEAESEDQTEDEEAENEDEEEQEDDDAVAMQHAPGQAKHGLQDSSA